MKKFLLAAAAVLVIACAGGGYAVAGGHHPHTSPVKPNALWCSNIIVSFPSTAPGPYVPQGTVLTAGSDGSSCQGTIIGYIWKRNGTAISGATASTYTTTSADAGATITVRVTGTIQSQDSINSAHVLGSSILSDDFNGANGTDPSSTTWSVRTDTDPWSTHNGWNGLVESGTGFVELSAYYSDQDGDGDTSSSTDTDSTSEPKDSAPGDWTTPWLQTSSTETGARWVENRAYYPCVDNDTGWTDPNSFGWEYAGWQGPGYGGSLSSEIDIWGGMSETTWGSPSGQNNGDYILSPAYQTWDLTGSADGDHDGDSVATDTDTPVASAGDGDEPDSDSDDNSVAESATGRGDNYTYVSPTTYNSSTDKQTSKVCGTWNTYGALIQAHSVQFYFNGVLNYTAYTNSTYGTPALGLSSTYDLTTVPMKQVFSLSVYQSPPQGAANTYMDVDYVHVNALS